MKKVYLFLLLIFSSLTFSSEELQYNMLTTLNLVEHTFLTSYAPADWKTEFNGWDFGLEIGKVRDAVSSNPDMSVKEYWSLLSGFFRSATDYHVGFSFISTERATLPLQFKSAEGRYFLTYFDEDKLSLFPFQSGDELVAFDGRPVQDVIDELVAMTGKGSPLTDQALAELYLTSRSASKAIPVPKGPVTLSFKRKGSDKVQDFQLVWDYTPEVMNYEMNWAPVAGKAAKYAAARAIPGQEPVEESIAEQINATVMVGADLPQVSNPFGIGVKKSFIPDLGKKVWESAEDDLFYAYIFLNEEGKLIGYVRIPSYGAGEKESAEFKTIIKRFEDVTDAMVIDQVNNPGGSVFYLYSLVSMLTDTALSTPKHHMKITPKEVRNAYRGLENLKDVKNTEGAQEYFGAKTLGGYPVDMNFVTMVKGYYQFIADQYAQGKKLTDAHYIWGVDKINPNKEVHYTKSILLLVNELDFSGGDFFPATLQDNERVTILGTRTAGAGGYVLGQSIPNLLGLDSFSVTGSIAKRVNDRPIENLGVTPDVDYKLTADDYQNNFKGYTDKIKETLKGLID